MVSPIMEAGVAILGARTGQVNEVTSVASDLAASGIGLVEDRSPIDVDRLPSDGTGLLWTQKQRHLRDLCRCLPATLKNAFQKSRELLVLINIKFARQLRSQLFAHLEIGRAS